MKLFPNDWKEVRELLVVIPCYGAVLILALLCIPYLTNQTSSTIQSYSLAINDFTTYKVGNDKITLNLDNNQGAKSSLYIYGLLLTSDINQVKFFVSDLYDQGGNSISAAMNIEIDPNTVNLTPITENPTEIKLDIHDSKQLGKFNGWFMLLVGDEIISVPITASTDPLYIIAILWVTTGALISIGTWELANFLDRLRTNNKFTKLNTFSESDQLSIFQKKVNLDAHLGDATDATKFSFVNFFTVVFGISAFYLALLSKPEVMELQTISSFDILSLIGLGLGIGSLSGFINKP